ncbi:MAG: hypothetical protein FJX76_01580 [Armatimonadetes bacterium]|nr:hypothetical protein [Armatimonadota bacterium]
MSEVRDLIARHTAETPLPRDKALRQVQELVALALRLEGERDELSDAFMMACRYLQPRISDDVYSDTIVPDDSPIGIIRKAMRVARKT